MATVLIALAYVDEMKLHHTLDYGTATYERVFLGALILANQVCITPKCLLGLTNSFLVGLLRSSSVMAHLRRDG